VQSRFGRAFDGSATSSEYKDPWLTMLDFVIGKPLDQALDRASQDYKWRELWNDPKVKLAVEQQVSQSLGVLVNRQADGDFFEDFSVLIQKPDPTNTALKQAVAEEQAAVAQANSEAAKATAQEAQAKADAAKANAQVAVAQAEAKKQKALIDGYGGPENYRCIYLADKGLNCAQPTYVVSGTAPGN
jgi:regulator of protease activity HflC (stomatin/prohibitin superfamily)